MSNLTTVLATPPYSLDKQTKKSLLAQGLCDLTRHHYASCDPYRRILDAISFKVHVDAELEDIPFLPVRLFKELDLLSVPHTDIVKTMTSSGTTGQAVSRIYLDRETSANQTKVLTKIVSSFIGNQRLPMLILDAPSTVKDRTLFSARGAGILGFSMFATDRQFAFDDTMMLNRNAIETFLEKYRGKRILLFGFTYIIWQHFYRELKVQQWHPDLSGCVLLHGGGWKKLADEAISPVDFRLSLAEVCGITKVHDYYGMVEQTGSIYMECELGHLHASIYSDLIVRRPFDFSPAEVGEKGIIEVLSPLPHSYPGHAILTEDEGVILGEDDCPCGRFGKYFKILGRLKNAEIRGCSDTYTARSF